MKLVTTLIAIGACLAPVSAALMEGTTLIYSGGGGMGGGTSKTILYAPDHTTILKQWSVGGYSTFFSDSGTVFHTTGSASNVSGCMGVTGYGAISEIRWDGTLIRSITAAQMGGGYFHHAFNLTSNGTILAIALENYNGACGEKIVEYDPNAGKILWVWHTNDHKGSGNAAKLVAGNSTNDPFHVNGVDFDPVRNVVIFSAHNTFEVYIVDHSTDSTVAKTSTGGAYGKGGDILFRFGKPSNYGIQGATQYIQTAVHSSRFVKAGITGTGNVLLYANQSPQSTSNWATGYEVRPVESGKSFVKKANGEFDYEVIFAGVGAKTETNMGGIEKIANGNWVVTYIGSNLAREFDATGASRQASTNALHTWSTSSSNGIHRYPLCHSGLAKVAETDATVAALVATANCNPTTSNVSPKQSQSQAGISVFREGSALHVNGLQGEGSSQILDLNGRIRNHQ